MNAAPNIAMINKEDPWPVYFPNPLIANVKMLDHMMELNSPIPINAHTDTRPVVTKAATNKPIASSAKMNKVLLGEALPI